MENPFAHLHVHSSFSPGGWGVRAPEEICAAARSMGMIRIALTDRNGLYGIPHFLERAKEEGLRPLVGAEAAAGGHRAVLLARDEEGYANLCRLLSDLHCRRDFSLPFALSSFRRGLAVLSDDPVLLSSLRRQGTDGLFVELSPGHGMHRALALSREAHLPPVATSRALLLSPEDLSLHRVLRAIALNAKISRLPPEETAAESDLLLPPARMAEFFPHCPEALENAGRLAAECKSDWDLSRVVFPSFRGLEDEAAFEELVRRSRKGAVRRYGKIIPPVEERLAKELAVIRAKGFAHYFLVVEELAHRSRFTCGRGSAAASLVAYCLGITHVDPLRHNLFFERFLHQERADPPDIDVDFPWDERDAVLDFAFARYGAKRAAMVANQVGFRGRAAIREVAKVYGIPERDISEVTDRISGFWDAEEIPGAMGLTDRGDEAHPLWRRETLDGLWREILGTAARLSGHLRHLSLHCGGLVVVPDEIRRYVPVETTAKGLPVIQWEKDQAEAAGLVKIDLLGNRSLAVIRDTLRAIADNTGESIDYASWRPLEDRAARDLLRSGETVGCFYIESPATRQLLRKMFGGFTPAEAERLDLFEHLVMASSIIRPAANVFIREFVARMRGKAWRPLHPLLGDVLDETYGIAVYQEQITRIAMALADFTAAEGDLLRKVISKKHRGRKLADFRERFLSGGTAKGVPEEVLAAVWEQILSFSGYSFCKPHSASYALVSLKSAYLKARHPAEFMAAVLSNQGGFYSPLAYLSEARRMGLAILPPDINGSAYPYLGRGRILRLGLMAVKGLSRKGADALLAERERGGPYRSFRDFLRRAAPDLSDASLLVKAGCFDDLEGIERRPALLWELLYHHQGNLSAPGGGSSPGLLFAEPPAKIPAVPPYDEETVLAQEEETLGFLASRHPLTLWREALEKTRTVPAIELSRHVGKVVTLAGWRVTGKPVTDRRGRPMEFVSFEDTTGLFDATFFPPAYERFCRILSRRKPCLLRGRVEEEFGVATLNVAWAGPLRLRKT